MKVDEFYERRDRRTSEEIVLGRDWTSASGATFSLFWLEVTGEVCALRTGPVAVGPGAPKPYGVYYPRVVTEGPDDEEVALLGTANVDEVRALVEGAEPAERTIEWLRERLTGAHD